jgi:hypothetical protein
MARAAVGTGGVGRGIEWKRLAMPQTRSGDPPEQRLDGEQRCGVIAPREALADRLAHAILGQQARISL